MKGTKAERKIGRKSYFWLKTLNQKRSPGIQDQIYLARIIQELCARLLSATQQWRDASTGSQGTR